MNHFLWSYDGEAIGIAILAIGVILTGIPILAMFFKRRTNK